MKTRILHLILIITLLLLAAIQAQAQPFQIRGIKGLWWNGIEKYRMALPWLAKHDMNFLMFCYSSFPASGIDWRSDYTAAEKEQFKEMSTQANKLEVNLCLSFNPGIWSKPSLVYSSEQDYQIALGKVKGVYALGIKWFGLCLDDINREMQPADKEKFKTLQNAQVYFVNRLWRDMKKVTPGARLIFCPSAYTTGDMMAHQDYIKTIGDGIDGDVMLFWTGPVTCSSSITAEDAKKVEQWFHRKPFIWDNYPVNDMYNWRLLVSPLKNRSADLASAVSGYIANPMKQWYVSTIPLATTAAYLNDPAGYDPEREMEKVIKSYPADQQRAIRLLVQIYGSTFWGDPSFPPNPPTSSEDATRQIARYRALQKELSSNPGLKDLWEDCRDTIESDIAATQRKLHNRLLETPLKAMGDDFEGGAGDIFGYSKFGKPVNYVYAQPTGRNEMHVDFRLDQPPSPGAILRILARGDDYDSRPKIRIKINDVVIFDGKYPLTGDFEAMTYALPEGALKTGINTLSIRNIETDGGLGRPPWFMVAEAEVVTDAKMAAPRGVEPLSRP